MVELTREEIEEVFYKLDIPIRKYNTKGFEVWQVPPITRDMHLYTSSD